MQKRTHGGRTADINHNSSNNRNNDNNNSNNQHSNNALVELVVGDVSSPTRSDKSTPSLLPSSSSSSGTYYQKHEDLSEHRTTTTTTADADDDDGHRGAVEYACNLIDTRPVSALGPKIQSVIAGLLSPTSSSSSSLSSSMTGLHRYALRRSRQHDQSRNQTTPSHVTSIPATTPTTANDFEYVDITNVRPPNTHQVLILHLLHTPLILTS